MTGITNCDHAKKTTQLQNEFVRDFFVRVRAGKYAMCLYRTQQSSDLVPCITYTQNLFPAAKGPSEQRAQRPEMLAVDTTQYLPRALGAHFTR